MLTGENMCIIQEVSDCCLCDIVGGGNREVSPQEAVVVAGTALMLSNTAPLFGHIAAVAYLYNWYNGK